MCPIAEFLHTVYKNINMKTFFNRMILIIMLTELILLFKIQFILSPRLRKDQFPISLQLAMLQRLKMAKCETQDR